MNDITASRLPRLAAVVGVLSIGLFVLPYVFPPSSTILSASSLAGFNNSLAYAWYVLGMIAGGYVLAGQVSGETARQAMEGTRPLFTWPTMPVVAVMAGHLALFAGLYLVAHGFIFGEPIYFEDAAYRAHAGAVPFVDFTFFYGPLLISPVVFLARFMGIMPAYAVYFIASYLAGLYLLHVVLSAWMGRGPRLRSGQGRDVAVWYVVFAIGFFNPITGLNYTLLRFLLPVVTLMAAWRCYRVVTARRWLAAVAVVTLSFLCSPDIAVVTLAAVGMLGLLLLWVEGRRLAVANYMALVGIPACGLALTAGWLLLIDGTWGPAVAYMHPIVTFSAGGWNTPIDPNLPMIALIAATLLVVSRLWRAWKDDPAAPVIAVMGAYGILLLLMQRASLGKADVVHIAFSGLPAFLAAVAWTPAAPERGRAPGRLAPFAIAAIVLPLQFYHALLFMPFFENRRRADAAAAASVSPNAAPIPAPATKAEIQASITRAVEHFGGDKLYYMHRLEYYRLPVYLQFQLKPFLYHPSLASTYTSHDIDGVIAQLRQHDAVVLARRSDLIESAPKPFATHWWYYVTSSPLPGSEVFNLTLEFQSRLEAPLVHFLNSGYYVRAFEDGEIVGLVHAIQ